MRSPVKPAGLFVCTEAEQQLAETKKTQRAKIKARSASNEAFQPQRLLKSQETLAPPGPPPAKIFSQAPACAGHFAAASRRPRAGNRISTDYSDGPKRGRAEILAPLRA